MNRILFNVGGTHFETTASTLDRAGPNSLFHPYLAGHLKTQDASSEIFIDRDPRYFEVLLNLLRSEELRLPPSLSERFLFTEASFYGLTGLVNRAKFAPLDGNRLTHQTNVYLPGRVPLQENHLKAIRPGLEGECAVIHGVDVHIFDSLMGLYASLNLDKQPIKNAMWLGSGSILIAAEDTIHRNPNVGGLASFSATTGAMEQRFYVNHSGLVESFTGGALCRSTDGRFLFGCCKDRASVNGGVAVWSAESGNQTQFLYDVAGARLGKGNRLERIDDNCLLVSRLCPIGNHSEQFMGLLDLRTNSLVRLRPLSDIMDVISIDEGEVCCLNENTQKLGFIDLRSFHAAPYWRNTWQEDRFDESFRVSGWYPRLAFNGRQIFSRIEDGIAVFSHPHWDMSSWWVSGRKSEIAIGGYRLFALHETKNEFDVFATTAEPSFDLFQDGA